MKFMIRLSPKSVTSGSMGTSWSISIWVRLRLFIWVDKYGVLSILPSGSIGTTGVYTQVDCEVARIQRLVFLPQSGVESMQPIDYICTVAEYPMYSQFHKKS